MSSLYDHVFPLTFELNETDKVPIYKSTPRTAPWLTTPLYGFGVVLPGDWCRYKATESGGKAHNLPMSGWFHRYLRKKAKFVGMTVPDCLPRVCDRNLRICVVAYTLNYMTRDEMVQYVATQQAQDFEMLCTLMGATPEEKLILMENWKWHRVPCSELDLSDTPKLPHTRALRLALMQ